MSAPEALTRVRGTRWRFVFKWFQADGVTPLDITGYTARLLIGVDQDGPYIVNIGSAGSELPTGSTVVVDGPGGTITFTVPKEGTVQVIQPYCLYLKTLIPGASPDDEEQPISMPFIIAPGPSIYV